MLPFDLPLKRVRGLKFPPFFWGEIRLSEFVCKRSAAEKNENIPLRYKQLQKCKIQETTEKHTSVPPM